MKEWWTPAELAEAKLPGMPTTPEAVSRKADAERWRKPDLHYPNNPKGVWRRRQGRGGGYEYRYDVLPMVARTKLMHAESIRTGAAKQPANDAAAADLWRWFDTLTDAKKKKAEEAVTVLQAVEALELSGMSTSVAVALVAAEHKVSDKTIYNWKKRVAGFSRSNWLPALAPRHVGRTAEAECSPEAWEILKADYMRDCAPDFLACYRRTERIAKARGLILPPARTMERRLESIPKIVRILAREGVNAAAKFYPAQIRDKSVFHACEAVNADGHTWDVFVKWPDGEIARPVMVGFHDLYSGKMLSWRFAKSENKETVLLAFGDLATEWGIPHDAWLDNGRSFASKWFTGGTENRYRFKHKETDPQGVLTALDVTVHWTTPYHGQSKPIERAWRDFARDIAKHPAFEGAYTGNSPVTKTQSYGKHAVPFEEFERVVSEEIAEWNARPGRRSPICAGRSFDEVFAESYKQHPILKATAEQARLWLLAAEGVKVQTNAQVKLMGNTFWCDGLIEHVGQPVVLRFDIDDLHAGVHVYRLDGAYVGLADCIEAVGFKDAAAAREHAQNRKKWLKSKQSMLDAEVRLGIDEVAAMLPASVGGAKPEAKVVRPAKLTNVKPRPAGDGFDYDALERGLNARESAQILDFEEKKKSSAA